MTTENNKLIAEFMEYPKHKIDFVGKRLNFENSKHNTYHKDWNWLMQVVEKIESLGYRVTIVRHICRIDLTEESKLIISENIKKIEAVYTVCFKFIQWYNQNKI